MGTQHSLEEKTQDQLEKLRSKSPKVIEKALREIWNIEDSNHSGFLERKEAEHFLHQVYLYITKTNEVTFEGTVQEVIQSWFLSYDKNHSGKISFEEFKQLTVNLIMNPLGGKNAKINQKVFMIAQITLDVKDPVLYKNSYANIIYKDDEMRTDILTPQNDFIVYPNIVYLEFPDKFEITIYKDVFGPDRKLGTFCIDVNQLKDKLVAKGQADAEGALEVPEGKPGAHWKIHFIYQEWAYYGTESCEKYGMNLFNKIFWQVVQRVQPPIVNAKEVEVPTKQGQPEFGMIGKIPVGISEYTCANVPFLVNVLNKSMTMLPMEEDKQVFTNREDAIELLGRTFGGKIPKSPEGEWTVKEDANDVTSDATLIRYFFYGIGAARVHRQENGAGYYVDLDPLEKYPVRSGCVPYQGKIFFNEKPEVTHIIWQGQTIKPEDKGWDFAKYLVRASALVYVTAHEHLMQSHLIWSNITTNANVINLSPDHPLRRLIHIHTYRAAFINRTAVKALAPPGGILTRLFAFDHHTLIQIFDDIWDSFKFYTFPELMKELNMENVDHKIYPMYQDGMDYWRLVEKYVHDYIHLFYNDTESLINDPEVKAFWTYLQKNFPNGLPALTIQNLITYLTQFIHYVSGMHIHAGNDIAYARDPAFAGSIVHDGSLMTTPQYAYTQTMLIVATSGKMPQMTEDFSHLLPPKAHEVWKVFRKELIALSEEIDVRNKSRPWTFNSMNPSQLVTSVAT